MLDRHLELMWAGALGVIPVAVGVAIACRLVVRRPATRHALWVIVMGAMFMPIAWWGATEAIHAARPHAQRLASGLNDWRSRWLEPSRATPTHETPGDSEAATSFDFSGFDTSVPGPAAARWDVPALDAGEDSHASSVGTLATPPPPFRDAARPAEFSEEFVAQGDAVVREEPAGPSPGWLDRATAAIGPWSAWGVRVRDAALGAPRLPRSVWFGGAILFALMLVWRVARLGRLVRGGDPVTARDQRLVGEVCELLGVRREPRMVVVDRVVTPMVCLGRHATIIVPRALWYGLGDEARRAILTHELAHLRRRDHWVCWAHLAVTCVFWWHPVSWWAGRRIREEADMACDAWVVSILPRARRAYAESLLRVRMFLSSTPPLAPAPALGMASSGVARFSRRITMVMTTSNSPRLSMFGGVAALAAAAIGAVIAPALACPPDSCDTPAPPAEVFVMPSGVGSDAFFAPEEATTFERFMSGGGGDQRAEELMERFREVEARMRELEAMIGRYSAGSGSGGPSVIRLDGFKALAPMAELKGSAGGLRATAPFGSGAVLATLADEDISRDYYLPGGRLEDLTELMSRSDVPVLIRSSDDHITVIGSEAEHAAFLGFVRIICPEGVRVTDENGQALRWLRAPSPAAPPAMPGTPALPRTPAPPSGSSISQSGGAFSFTPVPRSAQEAIERLNAHRDGLRSALNAAQIRQRQAEIEAHHAESVLERAQEQLEAEQANPAKASNLERLIAEYTARIAELEAQADNLEMQRDAMESQLDSAEDELDRLLEEAEEAAENSDYEEAVDALTAGHGR